VSPRAWFYLLATLACTLALTFVLGLCVGMVADEARQCKATTTALVAEGTMMAVEHWVPCP
jgi:hypothetical protein